MNQWNGIGRLVRDPELRRSQTSDNAVVSITIAVDRDYKREGEADVDYIPCKAFGKRAEFVEKYFSKGTRIGVTGRIQTGSYENKKGDTVHTTEIMVDAVCFADGKKEEKPAEPKKQKKQETPAVDPAEWEQIETNEDLPF